MLFDIFFVIIGFLLLVKGGDYLVESSIIIARKVKLSSMVIGMTIVGFGTSMPELLVSTQAAIVGSSGIAIGNVVGSNIANIALILGVTSIICTIPVKKKTLYIDVPFMLLSTVLLVIVGMSGSIGRIEGICGVLMLVAFVAWQVRHSRKKEEAEEKVEVSNKTTWKALSILIVSFFALVWGAKLLIDGASGIAMILGTSLGIDVQTMERVIGLTIVAVGTSFPELFASVIAARKGQTDMAIGNIIGSVTFNILSVIGVASAICPIYNSNIGFQMDYLIMLGLSLLLYLFIRTGYALKRWEGIVFTAIYLLYLLRTVIV